MQAVRFHAFGDEPAVEEVAEATVDVGEVLVEIVVAAVNPLDLWVVEGSVANGSQHLPFVLGVEAVGRASGRRVIVNGFGLGTVRDGLYRERASVPEGALSPIPDGVDDAQAAAVSVVGVTAKRIVDVARVAAGETVAVLGASGGVGVVAVQVAKRTGARVVAVTSSAGKRDALLALGADDVVVSSPAELIERFREVVPEPVHVVLNPLGGTSVAAATELLAPAGRQILFGRSESDRIEVGASALYRKNVTIVGFGGLADPPADRDEAKRWILNEIAAGRLHIPIAAELPLAQAARALDDIRNRRVEGKLILRVAG